MQSSCNKLFTEICLKTWFKIKYAKHSKQNLTSSKAALASKKYYSSTCTCCGIEKKIIVQNGID